MAITKLTRKNLKENVNPTAWKMPNNPALTQRGQKALARLTNNRGDRRKVDRGLFTLITASQNLTFVFCTHTAPKGNLFTGAKATLTNILIIQHTDMNTGRTDKFSHSKHPQYGNTAKGSC
jgi:hypothetical protein